jgi:18S rRNA (guanine1575-N7)-methyltransferase
MLLLPLILRHMQVGFSGGLVVDYPHSTRAKKFFLVLMVGPSSYVPQAKGIDGAGERYQLVGC